jgi:hypothetical protein
MTANASARRVWLSDDAVAESLLFIVLGAFALLTPAQNDTFWHLRSGRQMWETRWFLTSEPFSYTAFGAPLHNHWWLSQLAFYAAYAAGGKALLTIFAGSCAFLAVLGSWRLVRGPLEMRLVLLAFLAFATAPEWAVRPQVVSLALLVVMARLIDRDRIPWLPAICLIWANAHAMVVFGVVMAGACALEAVVWSRRFAVRDGVVACACIAVPTISPLGLQYWPRMLATVATSRNLQLQEYRMPLELDAIAFWAALAALTFLIVRHRRELPDHDRRDRILLVAAIILAIGAITAARNIAFFSVIAAPVLSRLWNLPNPPRRRIRSAGSVGYGLVTLTVVAAMAFVIARWQDGGRALGWRPIAASAIAAIRQCPDPTFNHFEDGGYLMWAIPERKIFIDSRIEAYPPTLLRRSRTADLFGDYRDLFRDFRIACALVRTGSPLDARLRADGMPTMYSDSSRKVFLTGSR